MFLTTKYSMVSVWNVFFCLDYVLAFCFSNSEKDVIFSAILNKIFLKGFMCKKSIYYQFIHLYRFCNFKIKGSMINALVHV